MPSRTSEFSPAVDPEDNVEVITIRIEELEEIDETVGLGVVSGACGDDTSDRPAVTNRYAVPPMPVAELPPFVAADYVARGRRKVCWTPEHGVTSQPGVRIGVMTRGHK